MTEDTPVAVAGRKTVAVNDPADPVVAAPTSGSRWDTNMVPALEVLDAPEESSEILLLTAPAAQVDKAPVIATVTGSAAGMNAAMAADQSPDTLRAGA